MANKKRNSFYIQGTVLAAASVISRLIGIVFRMPIARILGEEGYGAYSNAYEIYNMALLLSTFSIPTAVSRMVSARETKKEFNNSYRTLKVSFLFSSLAGLLMAGLVWIFADDLAVYLIKSPTSALPLKTLAPTIFVFSMMGVLRGFYQGKSTVIPTSLSQILEQIVHVGCGIGFAAMFMKIFNGEENSYAYGAAGATLGTLAGAIIAFLFLGVIFILYKPTLMRRLNKDKTLALEDYGTLLKLLLITMLPILLNQFLYSVTGNIDSVLFNHIMDLKGLDEITRLKFYGRYSGKFRLLTNVPLAIASAIGVAIIPNVVAALTEGKLEDMKLKIRQAVKLNMMIAIPCAFGLIALAKPIMSVLFDDASEMSVRLMWIGGLSVVFFAYSTTTNSILQGMGRLKFPVIHAIIGIVIYCIVDYSLLTYTDLSIYALAIGYMVFPFVVGALNWIRIGLDVNYRQEILRTFLLPTLFSAYMAAVAYFSYEGVNFLLHSEVLSLIVAIIFAVLIYAALMIFTKTITADEIREFPMGNRIVAVIESLGITL